MTSVLSCRLSWCDLFPMSLPVVIDNQEHRLAVSRNELLPRSVAKLLDIATAALATSGDRRVKDVRPSACDIRCTSWKRRIGARPTSRSSSAASRSISLDAS